VCPRGALPLRLDPDVPGGYEVVDSRTFDPRTAIETLHAAVPDGIIAVEDPGIGFKVSRLFPDGELIEDQQVVTFDELVSQPVTRVVLRAPGMSVERFSEIVADSGLHSVEYAIGWTAWLDVAPEGVTKASALEALIARLGTKDVARRVGLLPQSATVPGGMLVRDLVARGRFPHQGLFRQWSWQDRQAVEEAMEMVGVTELAARPVDDGQPAHADGRPVGVEGTLVIGAAMHDGPAHRVQRLRTGQGPATLSHASVPPGGHPGDELRDPGAGRGPAPPPGTPGAATLRRLIRWHPLGQAAG